MHSDPMVLRKVSQKTGPCERWTKALKTKLAQEGHEAKVYLDKMVLMMARRKAGPRERWTKTLKKELENSSRKPWDLVGNWHSESVKNVQLALSQGKKKKGDDVADDEDGYVVRTSVSQDKSDSNTVS
jgi:hypothetical protein